MPVNTAMPASAIAGTSAMLRTRRLCIGRLTTSVRRRSCVYVVIAFPEVVGNDIGHGAVSGLVPARPRTIERSPARAVPARHHRPDMHVLFDARLLHRPLSGLERVQRNLLRELGRHPRIDRLRVVLQHGTRLPETFPARAEPV